MRPARILVPIDFSDCSREALARADEMACGWESTLVLCHVHPVAELALLDMAQVRPPEQADALLEALHKSVAAWAQTLRTPSARIERQVALGHPVAEIVERSRKSELVIMGTHGRSGVGRFLLGSVAERVVQGAHCSVLIVKRQAQIRDL